MKKVFLFIALIALVISGQAQNQASVNLALHRKIAMADCHDEKMFVLIKGDIKKIKAFTEANEGIFLNSAGDIASVRLTIGALAQLVKQHFVNSIGSDIHNYRPMNDTMRMLSYVNEVHAGQAPLTKSFKGRGVVMGIIDSGLDLYHPDFKDSTGKTRVKWLWDMVLPDSANSPWPYDYGQEFNGLQIDSGLATAHTGEAEFGHGTYVAGIAAGNGLANGNFEGVATESDLVIVAYDFNAQDTVPRLSHAIEYIFNKAQLLGKPCVINASLGDYYGSHDGLDLESQYISNLINQQPGRVVVAAAGNIGINFPFHVGRTSVAGDTVFTWAKYNPGYPGVYFQIFADTADFRNVRFAYGADKVTPYYHSRGKTNFNSVFASINNPTLHTLMNGSNRIGRIQTYTTVHEGVYSIEVYIIPDSINYHWRFITTGNGKYDSWTFDWIWQNLPADSVFPDIQKYHSPDTMQSIVSGFTCLNNVITVGNYYNTDRHVDVNSVLQITPLDLPRKIAENSSRGPTRDGRIKPEITAPGHHIISAGVLSQIQGMISTQPHKVALGGYHITGGGTSASAPVVAGIAACLLEQNPLADWMDVKSALLNCAYQDTFMWGPYPNNAWGFGKAHAFESLTTCSLVNAVDEGGYDASFTLYPNPAGELVYLEMKNYSSFEIRIFDLQGRSLAKYNLKGDRFQIPVAELSNGIYFLSIETDSGLIYTRRLVKNF